MDVDVTVTIDGRDIDGEVTLVPMDGGTYGSWGQPDHWVRSNLLSELRSLSDDDFRFALDEIESAATAMI
jgi:hypothetical protein